MTSKIPTGVFDAIKDREGKKLLQPLAQAAGPVHSGEDMAKDSVAIWPEPQGRLEGFTIFASGLSGEFLYMTKVNGEYQPRKADDPPKEGDGSIRLVKTLELDYQVPGDVTAGNVQAIPQGSEKWIMR